ncbi:MULTISPECIES: NAD(P)H-binding protein [unclassified Crossiella]|uniref:NAD(P)H-binding protein n=1 Tax=unclassified Crossiella TaxID=2620835 RepID=UPI001FFFF8BF|nr:MULTISPECIES: NAD(P)H-binding protein [unclassified Crossiella]MCK2241689.1 NAD(P)H-binding protein [Crossiella sp. S99.2]MCK2255439.1 NAD(P)H-binding protein [Crossiella sp. S99.1]
MTILVAGATGTVGREVVRQLLAGGHRVRALTRNPEQAGLPAEVELARGDLSNPASVEPALEGVTGLHMITVAGHGTVDTGHELVALAARAGVQRVSVLGGWEETSVEQALSASELGWTWLRPVEFMANATEWAEEIRTEGLVRVFGNAPSAAVHEADIAAVAVAALTQDGHAGQSYLLTGPEALTAAERIALLSAATGHEIKVVQQTEEELRAGMAAAGMDSDYIDFAVELGANPPDIGKHPVPTVGEVVGRPALTFAQWATENADLFRPDKGSQ